MVRVFCIASLGLAAVSTVSGYAIRHKRVPPGWATALLQSYPEYHARYLEFDCEKQHNTSFFERCCHPLLNHESLSVLTNLGCKAPEDGCDENESSVTPSSSSQPAYTAPSPETPPSSSSSPATSPAKIKNIAPSPSPSPSPTPAASPSPAPAEPTSTPVTTSTKVPTPSPSPASSGNGGQNTGGVATFFYQKGVAGACGQVHSDSDFICAMDILRYGDAGNASPLCGKQVQITNTQNRKQVTVTVADACPTCDNDNSIDLSVAAFQQIADESQGEVPIAWSFV